MASKTSQTKAGRERQEQEEGEKQCQFGHEQSAAHLRPLFHYKTQEKAARRPTCESNVTNLKTALPNQLHLGSSSITIIIVSVIVTTTLNGSDPSLSLPLTLGFQASNYSVRSDS
jgi:hypothetical protein